MPVSGLPRPRPSLPSVSAASPQVPVQKDAALNALCQRLPVLLLVPLHALPALLLYPPLRTPTTAGTVVTMGTKLSVAVPPAPGFRETS